MLDYQTAKLSYQEYERQLEHDLLVRRFLRARRQENQRLFYFAENFINWIGGRFVAFGEQLQTRSGATPA